MTVSGPSRKVYAYHPCKSDVADLFKVTIGTRDFRLAADVTMNAGKPALLQIFSRTIECLVPERWREIGSFFVNSKCLEGVVDI